MGGRLTQTFAAGLAVMVLPLATGSPATAAATVIFVDEAAGGSADGSSWANAVGDLTTALSLATSGDEIRMAEGTYTNDDGPRESRECFSLVDGVVLSGGYPRGGGTESDPVAHPTILSGDVKGDDGPARSNRSDNCGTVVSAIDVGPGTVVYGLTISGGYRGSTNDGFGGGIFADRSTLSVVTTTVTGNVAFGGGGIFTRDSAVAVVNSTISDNTTFYNGAGISNLNSAVTLSNSLVTGNQALFESVAGGILTGNDEGSSASLQLVNTTVADNTAVDGGAGIFHYPDYGLIGGSTVTISNTIVWGNAPGNVVGPASVMYSDVQGWVGGGAGNINTNPLFVGRGDYRLQAGSPARDRGRNLAVAADAFDLDQDGNVTEPAPDLAGTRRVVDGTVDLGAHETTAGRLAAGSAHTCALRSTSVVRCWGANASGQLGDGTTTPRGVPSTVPGLTGVRALTAGDSHTCGLLADRTVKCWGLNSSGQLGDGTLTSRPVPTLVPGLNAVVSIVAAKHRTCAVVDGGGTRCWGSNANGELGDGTRTSRRTPVSVASLSAVSQLTAGSWHTCAVLVTGGLRCWGSNTRGQLGDGSTVDRLSPVNVVGLANVTSAAAIGSSTCAISMSALRCWGLNHHGQVGDGTIINRTTPVPVFGMGQGVADVAGGLYHACARRTTGSVFCWGYNSYGNLGDGTQTQRTRPVSTVGASDAVALAAGPHHTLALLDNGQLLAWGANGSSQLGNNSTHFRKLPKAITGL